MPIPTLSVLRCTVPLIVCPTVWWNTTWCLSRRATDLVISRVLSLGPWILSMPTRAGMFTSPEMLPCSPLTLLFPPLTMMFGWVARTAICVAPVGCLTRTPSTLVVERWSPSTL